MVDCVCQTWFEAYFATKGVFLQFGSRHFDPLYSKLHYPENEDLYRKLWLLVKEALPVLGLYVMDGDKVFYYF